MRRVSIEDIAQRERIALDRLTGATGQSTH
jgi:hypothetical protein